MKKPFKKQFKILAFFLVTTLIVYLAISLTLNSPCGLKNQAEQKNQTEQISSENPNIQCKDGKCIATIIGFLDPPVTIIGNETMNGTARCFNRGIQHEK